MYVEHSLNIIFVDNISPGKFQFVVYLATNCGAIENAKSLIV